MPECIADATWTGTVREGAGEVSLERGAWTGEYGTALASDVTNPEELLAAAHASCFAMTVAWVLAESGFTPDRISTESAVTIDFGEDELSIPTIETLVSGRVPDVTAGEFDTVLEEAERACPVSNALAGTDIRIGVSSID